MGRVNYPTVVVNGERKRVHIMLAERALGRSLPKGAVVHHVDGDIENNEPSNLVICQSQAYHKLLHQRTDALAVSGHADWRKCWLCQQHDSPANLVLRKKLAQHARCAQEYERSRPKRKKYIRKGYAANIERLRLLNSGRKMSAETIERMRQAALKREARKRESVLGAQMTRKVA